MPKTTHFRSTTFNRWLVADENSNLITNDGEAVQFNTEEAVLAQYPDSVKAEASVDIDPVIALPQMEG